VAIGAFVLTGLIGTAALPMIFEDSLLYHPERKLSATPADYGLTHEDVWLATKAGRAHAWYLPARGRATVLFFHGNAGTIADRLPHASAWVALGVDVLLVEYPGYGRSEGEPGEAAFYAAADAAYAWAKKKGKPLVAFGESLGGAVAIDLAAKRKVDALVVQSTFTSVADMAKAAFPWLPFSPPLRNRYESIAKIGRVHAPKLFLHGDQDDVVPFSQGERLFRAAQPPKRFVKLQGAHHNDTIDLRGSEYFGAVEEFLRGLGW
jgi:uncharacterized protein